MLLSTFLNILGASIGFMSAVFFSIGAMMMTPTKIFTISATYWDSNQHWGDSMYSVKPIFFMLVSSFVVLTLSSTAHARTISEITPVEYREQGYPNKEAFVTHFTSCLQVRSNLEKSHICVDTACVRAHPNWKKKKCDRNSEATYFLLMKPNLPIKPASNLPPNVLLGYSDSFRAACLKDYLTSPSPHRLSDEQSRRACECAADESLKLISADDYLQFPAGRTQQEILVRSQYAKDICEYRVRTANGK